MTANITLTPRERDKLIAAADILREYSALFSAIVKGKEGTFFDDAATAAGMIDKIIQKGATE